MSKNQQKALEAAAAASRAMEPGYPGLVGSLGTGRYHDAKLSQEYAQYDLIRAKKMAKNAAFLESMGLSGNGQNVNMKADNAKKKAKAAARRKAVAKQKLATPPDKERRSSRVSKEPVLFEALPADAGHYISDDEEGPRKPRRTYVARSRIADEGFALTAEQQEEMETACGPNFLNKLEKWLRFKDKVSEQNCRSVMQRASQLASGEGIGYHHWPASQVFRKAVKITPGSDFVEMFQDALAFIAKQRVRDLSNGWLLTHPIRKLMLFQQFIYKNPKFLESEDSISSFMISDGDYGGRGSAGSWEESAESEEEPEAEEVEAGKKAKKSPKKKSAAVTPPVSPKPPAKKAASPKRTSAGRAMPALGSQVSVQAGHRAFPGIVSEVDVSEIPDSAPRWSKREVAGFVVAWEGEDSESFVELESARWTVTREPEPPAEFDPRAVVGEALATTKTKGKRRGGEKTVAKKAARKLKQ